MNSSLPCYLFCLCLLLVSGSVHAFVDPPFLYPAQPVAGHPVDVKIRSGECDGFIEGEPGFPKIERNGQSIRLLVRGTHRSDPILCISPIVVATTSIGSYEEGHYTLQVDRFYAGLEVPTTETIGILSFDVVAAARVPAGGIASWCLLALMLIAGTAIFRRRKLLLLATVAGCLSESAERARADTNQFVEVLLSSAVGAPP